MVFAQVTTYWEIGANINLASLRGHGVRVLHVTATRSLGGVPIYVRSLIEDQVDRGWEPTLLGPANGWIDSRLPASVTKVDWRRSSGPIELGVAAVRLRRLVADLDPDVVHLHASVAGALGRVLVSSVPVVFQPHAWSFYALSTPLRQPTVLLERSLARRAAVVLCGSPGEADEGRRRNIGRLATIDNAVDTEYFRPASPERRAALRRELSITTPLVVAAVSRLEHQKNPEMLLDAWRTAGRDDATLLVVGKGSMEPRLRRNLPPGVRLLGPMDDPLPIHQVADLTIMTSRYETRSLSLLEAMACGSPVVTTDVSGVDHVGPARAGSVVAQSDTRSFAFQLNLWLDHPAELAAARVRAREVIETGFNRRRWADKMVAMYLDVVGQPQPIPGNRGAESPGALARESA